MCVTPGCGRGSVVALVSVATVTDHGVYAGRTVHPSTLSSMAVCVLVDGHGELCPGELE